jgi:CMP-N-acetylneuraminic acid synthetase
MKAVAFIFARGGSKGLPGKNIRPLSGKPLIAWSIQHALVVKRIDRVIVSTDSDEIAETARQYGAEVPFMRPAELAVDNSPEWLAWRHALNYLKESTGTLPEAMVSVPTTAPLRLPIDIENCLDEYEKGDADIVITVTDSYRSPYFNMVKTNVMAHNSTFEGRVKAVHVPTERAIDIDTLLDFHIAECLLNIKVNKR